eukprot:GHVN01052201.1.p1 GENE.GHVN01052201.1~~GHVN01052201.1.p1  ORF type:complete len:198 (-),score=4.05 GHVN01052201.1:27-569(-)
MDVRGVETQPVDLPPLKTKGAVDSFAGDLASPLTTESPGSSTIVPGLKTSDDLWPLIPGILTTEFRIGTPATSWSIVTRESMTTTVPADDSVPASVLGAGFIIIGSLFICGGYIAYRAKNYQNFRGHTSRWHPQKPLTLYLIIIFFRSIRTYDVRHSSYVSPSFDGLSADVIGSRQTDSF